MRVIEQPARIEKGVVRGVVEARAEADRAGFEFFPDSPVSINPEKKVALPGFLARDVRAPGESLNLCDPPVV